MTPAMFNPVDIVPAAAAFVGSATMISALVVQCSSKKKAAKATTPVAAKPDPPPAPASNAGPPSFAPQAAVVTPSPPNEESPVAPKPEAVPAAPKSELKKLDKTQTGDPEPPKTEGGGNEAKTKDDEDTFEQHKPQAREAKRAKEIVSKQPVPKHREDYKTFNKKNMPESDFDKTMSGVGGV
ncbi:hypothetical protein L596_013611 [Steinernema carpocapsae]|uniref:Uncharacterized protein n=1 Tax=Steinernema carpocapsae TaxID=34508 RepID=A0A4U5P0Q0_STECR|nr:hypothetical protein L596_013611 [Steinernema carpocapsae]